MDADLIVVGARAQAVARDARHAADEADRAFAL